jgi:hypothetical protein
MEISIPWLKAIKNFNMIRRLIRVEIVKENKMIALKPSDAVIFVVRHQAYCGLKPAEVVEFTGGPAAIIDCFCLLKDQEIHRYFELGCEVKGMGRGHIKRIKDEVKGRR